MTEFYPRKEKGREGQFLSYCIACRKQEHIANREVRLANMRLRHVNNRASDLENSKRWRLENPERFQEYTREYIKNKRNTDPIFKMKSALRNLVATAIRKMGYVKSSKTEQIIGCPFADFKAHFDKQFKPGMTWLNHGKWHIDHKIPLIQAKTEEELIKLNHYTNLQPLWADENFKKGSKYNIEQPTISVEVLPNLQNFSTSGCQVNSQ